MKTKPNTALALELPDGIEDVRRLVTTLNDRFRVIGQQIQERKIAQKELEQTVNELPTPGELPGAAPTNPFLISVKLLEAFQEGGKRKLRFGLKANPPAPLGTYAGLHLYVEAPDGSDPAHPRKGIGEWKLGTDALSNEFAPLDLGKFPYREGDLYAAVFIIDEPKASMTARAYGVPYSADVENMLVAADQPDPSPSITFTLSPSRAGVAGLEYAGLVVASDAGHVLELRGGVWHDVFYPTWTSPNDGLFDHCIVTVKDLSGKILNVGYSNPGDGRTPSNWFPCGVEQTALVYFQSAAAGDNKINSIVEGLTPCLQVTIGRNGGVIDLAQAFGFNGAEFEIDPIQGYRMKAVDFSKGFNGFTIDGSEIPQITIAPDGAALGWIGKDALSGYAGAWFKRVTIGGTSPADAPFFADATGKVVMNGLYVNNAGTPLGWIGANGADVGAWFKKLGIGGTSLATAKVKADEYGNVTIDGATFALSLNGVRTEISNGVEVYGNAGMKITDTVNGNYTVLYPWRLTIHDATTTERVSMSAGPQIGGIYHGLIEVSDSAGNKLTLSANSIGFVGASGITGTVNYAKSGGGSGTITVTGGIVTGIT